MRSRGRDSHDWEAFYLVRKELPAPHALRHPRRSFSSIWVGRLFGWLFGGNPESLDFVFGKGHLGWFSVSDRQTRFCPDGVAGSPAKTRSWERCPGHLRP